MPVAARVQDPIMHSNALTGLLVGALAGAAFGVFVVATGGAGLVVGAAIIGGAVATGAGIGEALGSLSISGGTITGLILTGSGNTSVNSLLAARATLDSVACRGTPPIYIPAHDGKRVAQGAATVSINGMPAARVGDKIECGSKIQAGSGNVLIGGPTVTTLDIDSEVPFAYHAVIFVVGLASAVILAGPVVAIVGTVGSLGLGMGAQYVAASLGASEDVQILAGLGGSLLGGFLGGKLGGRLGQVEPIANLERAAMRPLLENAPGYRADLAGMRGASPSQVEARTQIAGEQVPGTQAAAAAGWQGKGSYPGIDPLENTTMRTGERYYAGLNAKGEPTGYFVSEQQYNDFIANGGTRDEFWQGLQVSGSDRFATPDNPNGYRNSVGIFEVNNDFPGANGPTVANPQYGPGGLEQYYSDQWSGNVTQVGTANLPATPNPGAPGYSGPGGTYGAGVGGANAGIVTDHGQGADDP